MPAHPSVDAAEFLRGCPPHSVAIQSFTLKSNRKSTVSRQISLPSFSPGAASSVMLSSQNCPRSSAQRAEVWEQMSEKNQEAFISG